jgi:hypothetical protein
MASIVRGDFPQHLLQSMQIMAGEEFKALPLQTEGLFEVKKSNRASELGVMYTGGDLPSLKPESARLAMDRLSEHFTVRVTHKVYGKAFSVSMEMLADDIQGKSVRELISLDLAKTAVQNLDISRTGILNNAFSGSYVGGDGVALVSASHPLGRGGTFSNLLSAEDLSESSLETALIAVAAMVDNVGRVMPVNAKKLIIPPGEIFNAARILKTVGRPGSADNDINAIRASGMISLDPMVNKYLTDADAWFILTDVPNGLIHFDRTPFTLDTDKDFLTKDLLISGHQEFSHFWIDPRCILGNQGA